MSDLEATMSTDLHHECWLLLPWAVTGRLSAMDRQRVEQHLPDCAECRAELERQQVLCEHIRRDDSVMLAPQASLQKLLARIDGIEPAPQAEVPATSTASMPVSAAPVMTARPKQPRAPRWLAIAAGVQAIGIAALLALVWIERDAEMGAPRFTTLTTPAAAATDAVVLRVVFRPEMTNAELQDLLHGVDARVVAGPTEAGVYSLQLPEGSRSREVAQTLATMRANPHVVFAEHVSTELVQ